LALEKLTRSKIDAAMPVRCADKVVSVFSILFLNLINLLISIYLKRSRILANKIKVIFLSRAQLSTLGTPLHSKVLHSTLALNRGLFEWWSCHLTLWIPQSSKSTRKFQEVLPLLLLQLCTRPPGRSQSRSRKSGKFLHAFLIGKTPRYSEFLIGC
jgi:hypothetical protein